ncbi:unnamed protein product [Ilex paraguariensis]|uniref:Protein kinase domain-containing protein n=1 Tax=Ilex paraguariensis TaxID=185542 RepID=A0ABC8TTM1_9AQUA
MFLDENQISGSILGVIANLSSLELLHMSNNQFTVHIPPDIGKFQSLQELKLSSNQLFGNVPSFLGNLTALTQLRLDRNNLQGNIPSSLVDCQNLIALDLSWNSLNGTIPHQKNQQKLSSDLEGNSLLKVSYQSLLQATDGFSTTNWIGMGSFVSVYKGILDPDGTIIVVKVFNLSHHEASKSFIAECETLRSIRHRNLVKVLTACSSVDYQGNDFKALVYEFMENGSVERYLHPNQIEDLKLNLLQRVNIGINVAYALDYLHHGILAPIVHRDIKPSNVLLDKELVG